MQRCSSGAERFICLHLRKESDTVFALSYKRMCVERDTNAFALEHVSAHVHAIYYQLHAYTCKRPHTHLNAYIWMHAYVHAFMNAIAVGIKRMQSHI